MRKLARKRDVRLTLKQRKWLEVYIETGNMTEAGMQAYNCKDRQSAGRMGRLALAAIRGRVAEMLDAAGLDDVALLRRVKEGLEAETIVTTTWHGEVVDRQSYPDHRVRRRYLEMALRLRALYPEDRRKEREAGGDGARRYLNTTDLILSVRPNAPTPWKAKEEETLTPKK